MFSHAHTCAPQLQIQFVMKMHIFNPRIWEAETDGILLVQNQNDLHNGFQAIQDHTVRSSIKNK